VQKPFRRIALAAVIEVLLVEAVAFPVSSTSPFTCGVCRLERVDSTYFGFADSTFHENECSRWFRAQVDSAHRHTWDRGVVRGYSLIGLPVYVVTDCYSPRFTALSLTSSTQLAFCRRVEDPMEAVHLFESMADASMDEDRSAGSAYESTLEAIKAWEAEGFPGTWKEWLSTYGAYHVGEPPIDVFDGCEHWD